VILRRFDFLSVSEKSHGFVAADDTLILYAKKCENKALLACFVIS